MNSTTQLRKKQSATLATLQPLCTINIDGEKAGSQSVDFDRLLLSAVDSTFSILGGSAANAMFSCLKNCGLDKESIPQNVERFARMLEEIFGEGAFILESFIIQSLHSEVKEFKYASGRKGLSFPMYLGALHDFLRAK